jgi:hypothetical protein
MLTIFTTPKPFAGHIDVIQRNAIGSWLQLGDEVEVLLIGDEEGMDGISQEYHLKHFPEVECNHLGTPLVNSIFQIAEESACHSTLCYINADILLMDDFIHAVNQVNDYFQTYLMIGQRWDLQINDRIVFNENWKTDIQLALEARGQLHPPAGSDYFVYKRGSFRHMPSFALGRAGWDNWMIYAGRAGKLPVVDVTKATTVIHQDHDYAHLPNGQPHYRLPESEENVRLSGGQETIFTLADADWFMDGDQPRRKSLLERLSRRGIEASVISSSGPGIISSVTRMILHPMDTFQYYLNAIRRRFGDSPMNELD